MRVSSPDPVHLIVENQQVPKGHELVIIEEKVETALTADMEMELDNGDWEVIINLRPLPKATQLLPNYPNPFNPETWIPFQLAEDEIVTAKICDLTGKRIRMIELGHISAGNYVESGKAIYWDGKTETGELVSSGTYFYQIDAGDYRQARKMVILK